jgi:hypothetical protein
MLADTMSFFPYEHERFFFAIPSLGVLDDNCLLGRLL